MLILVADSVTRMGVPNELPFSSNSTVLPETALVPARLMRTSGLVTLVMASKFELPLSEDAAMMIGLRGVPGAVVSSVMVNAPPAGPTLPATSVMREVRTLVPSAPRLPLTNVMSI